MELLCGRVTGPRDALFPVTTTLIYPNLIPVLELEETTLAAEVPQLSSREVGVMDKFPSSNLTTSSHTMITIRLVIMKNRHRKCPCSRIVLKYPTNIMAAHHHDPKHSRKQLL